MKCDTENSRRFLSAYRSYCFLHFASEINLPWLTFQSRVPSLSCGSRGDAGETRMKPDGTSRGKQRASLSMMRASLDMETGLFNRLQAILLALATAGLVLLAVLNFRQESRFQQPDDGVWWVESQRGLLATKVIPDSPGARAGIQKGDLLTAVNGMPVTRVPDYERALYRTGVWLKANYSITRSGTPMDSVMVIPEPPDRSSYLGLRLIGLIYLGIGLYVLFRRWTAPRATHF